MSSTNIPSALRLIARVSDLHTEKRADLRAFILNCEDGDFTFTNDLGEAYVLRQKAGVASLILPGGDNSGDPSIVAAFAATTR